MFVRAFLNQKICGTMTLQNTISQKMPLIGPASAS
jgi:hypothetical protein